MTENLVIWLHEGKNKGAVHLMLFLDTSSDAYFPVYVMPHENLNQKRRQFEKDFWTFAYDHPI
ncbi:MAG: hypothetical protein M1G31_14065 [Pseudanabaena sp. Salubria-1]|nr:hypothetical protein [Pseudanabaena sp. Salubria-1]